MRRGLVGRIGHSGRRGEAEFADRYVRAFIGSARSFPWRDGDARWQTKCVWRVIEERAAEHALALVAGHLLDGEHFEALYEPALVHECA